jgi:rhodanese-related sulfurtransferase
MKGAGSLRRCRIVNREICERPASEKTTQAFLINFNCDFRDMITATMETAGKAKEFFAQKLDFTVSPDELNEQIETGGNHFIVDVREVKDFIKGHVPGAISLPSGCWNKITAWRKDRPVIIYGYSQSCHLAARAAMESAEQGYTVLELEGGFEAWKKGRLALEY